MLFWGKCLKLVITWECTFPSGSIRRTQGEMLRCTRWIDNINGDELKTTFFLCKLLFVKLPVNCFLCKLWFVILLHQFHSLFLFVPFLFSWYLLLYSLLCIVKPHSPPPNPSLKLISTLHPYKRLNKGSAFGMLRSLLTVLILKLSLFSHVSPLEMLLLPHRGFLSRSLKIFIKMFIKICQHSGIQLPT